MRNLISLGIMGAVLITSLPCFSSVSEKVFREPKGMLEEKVLKKVKNEFGWKKDVVEQRLADGIYTETEINEFIDKSCQEVVDEEVAMLTEKMKPVELTPITIRYITLEELKLAVTKLNPNEIRVLVLEGIKLHTISLQQLEILLTKLDIAEIQSLLIEGIKFEVITPSQLKILLTKLDDIDLSKFILSLEVQDLNKFVRLFEQAYGFAIDQREFYEAWNKRDVKSLISIIQSAKTRQLEFFTAWGNYQDFTKINFGRHEPLQNRQVLVSSLNTNWRNLFKPVSPNIILTINFGLSNYEIKALLELINENRNYIKAVILPWGSADVNNFDNRNISTYLEVADWCDRLAYSIRETAPEIPIGLTVCVCPSLNDWVSSFHFPYDFLNVWNILNSYKSNLKKVSEMLSPYNKTLILSTFQCNPDAGWISFDEARKITFQSLDRVKESGFSGIILMTNSND